MPPPIAPIAPLGAIIIPPPIFFLTLAESLVNSLSLIEGLSLSLLGAAAGRPVVPGRTLLPILEPIAPMAPPATLPDSFFL